MTATKGLGTYGNAAGTVTPLDHKMAQLGLVTKSSGNSIRPGLFWGGSTTLVVGKANMSYDVSAFTAALSRSSTAGAVLLSNDGTYNVATTAAPGSNSRIDLVYVWQREYSIDGTDSNPVIGVAQGTPAVSPVAPSLAAFPGAITLAQVTVPTGITATTSATITQVAPFTSAGGGVVVVRNSTERAGTTPYASAAWVTDQRVFQADTGVVYRYDGANLLAWESPWITFTPTLTNLTVGTGGSAATTCKYRFTGGEIEVDMLFVLGSSGFSVGTNPIATTPVNVATVQHASMVYSGGGSLYDLSALVMRPCFAVADATANRVRLYMWSASVAQGYDSITATTPWTWAAGDTLRVRYMATPA